MILHSLKFFMNADHSEIDVGYIKLNTSSHKVFVKDSPVFLRNKEFALLEYFMQNMGKVLSRTQILEDVWDRNICCPTNTVDVHVSSLRKKVGKYFGNGFIRTVHCVGYIFEL